jgi:hypothetical protein
MKITKRQLRRIIKEEKAKILKEWFSDEHDPKTGKRDGDYSTGRWDGLEQKLDTVLYELQAMFREVNGVEDIEAAEMVLDECARTLGVVR